MLYDLLHDCPFIKLTRRGSFKSLTFTIAIIFSLQKILVLHRVWNHLTYTRVLKHHSCDLTGLEHCFLLHHSNSLKSHQTDLGLYKPKSYVPMLYRDSCISKKRVLAFTCCTQGEDGNSSALLFSLPILPVQKQVFFIVFKSWTWYCRKGVPNHLKQ